MNTDALLASSAFVGFVVLALLVADAISAWVDARHVRDDEEPDALTRRRIRDLAWLVAIVAALAVIIAFAVDSAARAVWDANDPVAAALILFAVTVFTFVVGVGAVVAAGRRERPSYARIRRDLRDRAIYSFDDDELLDFERRLSLADRTRARRSQNALPLRLLGVAVVVALAVASWLLAPGVFSISFTIGAVVSLAAGALAVRADVARQAALTVVLETQRAEVVALLERARIPQRRRVPGLRDRVSRALAILREQQD
ncbi:hypothetical protein [uncultured Schumannella sp.]|uniref:hypothetical protein n=1 Tax=uncultured Schumannella sp. TaxID=1195956 RepID=UPI0025F8CA19|nr:hypothetical protein [uncultured Schumannella sp.]